MVVHYTLITGIYHLYIFRYSTIVTSGNEDISLLPFLGEKHICILFFILIFILDSGIKRNTKLYAIGVSEMLYTV